MKKMVAAIVIMTILAISGLAYSWCSNTDINRDGNVDIQDFSQLKSHYGETGCKSETRTPEGYFKIGMNTFSLPIEEPISIDTCSVEYEGEVYTMQEAENVGLLIADLYNPQKQIVTTIIEPYNAYQISMNVKGIVIIC